MPGRCHAHACTRRIKLEFCIETKEMKTTCKRNIANGVVHAIYSGLSTTWLLAVLNLYTLLCNPLCSNMVWRARFRIASKKLVCAKVLACRARTCWSNAHGFIGPFYNLQIAQFFFATSIGCCGFWLWGQWNSSSRLAIFHLSNGHERFISEKENRVHKINILTWAYIDISRRNKFRWCLSMYMNIGRGV